MTNAELESHYSQLLQESKSSGYYLNPDKKFVFTILEGLLKNRERHGYDGCPCIENTGDRSVDLDIICPCDFRDSDLEEYGTCYCGLFVSEKVIKKNEPVKPIPLRRTIPGEKKHIEHNKAKTPLANTSTSSLYPVWRCSVCGYLCARNTPPLKCPICKVDQDRFQNFQTF